MASDSSTAKQTEEDVAPKGFLAHLFSFIKNAAALSAVVVAVGAIVLWGVAYWEKQRDPRPMIVVQPFEEASDIAKKCGMTGKNAEDIFVDQLNDLVTAAAHFHGNVNTNQNALGLLAQRPRIPVETAYGITVHGISVDDVLKLYDRVRYEQWIITGDVLGENDVCDVRVRLTTATSSSGWNIPVPKGKSLSETIQVATFKLITSADPELAGRALLQEIQEQMAGSIDSKASDAAAEEAFKEWLNSRPQDMAPYFYLMTTFIYENKPSQASEVFGWVQEGDAVSKRVKEEEQKIWRGTPLTKEARRSPGPASSMEDNLQSVEAAAKVVENTSTNELIAIKSQLDRLRPKYPMDTKYIINSAVASSKIADNIETSTSGKVLTPDELQTVSRRRDECIQLLLDAIEIDPSNPGVHRSLGNELVKLAITRGQAVPAEAIDEYKFALHLRPSFKDAYDRLQLLLKSPESDQITETISLLLPAVLESPPSPSGAKTKMVGRVSKNPKVTSEDISGSKPH
ncbi:hypothetical protein RBB77_07100 [Tunturibacter psychrotolerans]|uniref:Tetratricopeptide repeat protein n=1 Tax=Tunturiibacter psychrotolerans TaxID=3069686 RepID=A0AAU7ZUM8_9BACT